MIIRRNIKLLLIFCLLLIYSDLLAQFTVDFSVPSTSLCAPANIQFMNTTTGCGSNYTYLWTTSNGGESRTIENPVFNFSSGGRYTIKLEVTCNGETKERIKEIVVYNPPIASITGNPTYGCVPYTTTFTQSSTQGVAPSGPITRWKWDFGNGTPQDYFSSDPVSNTFNTHSHYNISLIVVDENGCADTVTRRNFVTVSRSPQIDFFSENAQWCNVPYTVNFTSDVTAYLDAGYSLVWNFGSGQPPGTGSSPSATYNFHGNFPVTLTATDDYGCTATLTKENFVKMNRPRADFFLEGGYESCVERNSIFVNSTIYDCLWIFEDYTSDFNTVSRRFTTPGDHAVRFVVDPNGPCRADTNFVINTEIVIADYRVEPADLIACESPFVVSFFNESSENAVGFEYIFSTGSTNDYAISSNSDPIHIYEAGVHIPRLIATSERGCSGTSQNNPTITVFDHKVFVPDYLQGCCEEEIFFEIPDVNFPLEDLIYWCWNFDGTNSISSSTSPIGRLSHIYNIPGRYTATLTLHLSVTVEGEEHICEFVRNVPVEIGTPYYPEFSVHTLNGQDTICPKDIIVLNIEDTDTCSGTCNIQYRWMFTGTERSDATIGHIGEEYYNFVRDTGYIHISLSTTHNGCTKNEIWNDSIYVLPSIIPEGISYSNDCETPLDYAFHVDPIGADEWTWEIWHMNEDIEFEIYETINNTDNTVLDLLYTFPDYGIYMVKITCLNHSTQCVISDSVRIWIIEQSAHFEVMAADSVFCIGEPISFATESADHIISYFWDFKDGSIMDWSEESDMLRVSHSFREGGIYDVTLKVMVLDGCIYEYSIPIKIVSFDIAISPPGQQGCVPMEVEFTNVSEVLYDELTGVSWQFSNMTYGSAYELINEVTHSFIYAGSYSVTVTLTTERGCNETLDFENIITASTANAGFNVSTLAGCIGADIDFSAVYVNNDYIYKWNFGDNIIDEGRNNNIAHAYSNGGTYDVSLIVNNNNCIVEETATISIEGVLNADFSITPGSYFSCYPVQVKLVPDVLVDPSDAEFFYEWRYEGGASVVQEPIVVFYNPDEYNINLIVATSNGCEESVSESLIIEGPYGEMSVSDTSICVGSLINFSVSAVNTDSLEWVMGDGSRYNTERFDHLYDSVPEAGYFPVSLLLYKDTCRIALPVRRIYVHDARAEFSIIDELGQEYAGAVCSPLMGSLVSNSVNDENRWWLTDGVEYGTGEIQESMLFENIGLTNRNISISLIVESLEGCRDTLQKNVEVLALPPLFVSSDTLICLGDEISLTAEGGIKCEWTPDQYISDINSYTPFVKPEENITYTVRVENSEECSSIDSVRVMVQQIPEVSFDSEDYTLIVGETIQINVIANQDDLIYTWTPDYNISCNDCPYPVLSPIEDTTYFLVVEDSLQCIKNEYTINVTVEEIYTVDVPMAFTPQSGDENSIVYVKGYGIKKLMQFRIFNRWGDEVFFSDDLNHGWDGYVNGKLQNMDNYSYIVEVEMYNGVIQSKKGYIMLMR